MNVITVLNEVTPCGKSLFEKLIVKQTVKKSPAFYGTRKLVHYCVWKSKSLIPTLTKINPVHNNAHSLITIFIIPHIWLGLPSGLFSSNLPITIFYVFLTCAMSAHFSCFKIPLIIFSKFKLWAPHLCYFHYLPVSSLMPKFIRLTNIFQCKTLPHLGNMAHTFLTFCSQRSRRGFLLF
jgi:hypothetical protein